MAFVAVPHFAPTHPSALADILARSTSMPVVEILDGQAIAPNTIYVLSPGQDLTVESTGRSAGARRFNIATVRDDIDRRLALPYFFIDLALLRHTSKAHSAR